MCVLLYCPFSEYDCICSVFCILIPICHFYFPWYVLCVMFYVMCVLCSLLHSPFAISDYMRSPVSIVLHYICKCSLDSLVGALCYTLEFTLLYLFCPIECCVSHVILSVVCVDASILYILVHVFHVLSHMWSVIFSVLYLIFVVICLVMPSSQFAFDMLYVVWSSLYCVFCISSILFHLF